MANIIILNGVSSAGKTTISKKIQSHFEEHYLWISNDSFCDMCSSTHWKKDWKPIINIALKAMVHSIKASADIGLNMVVDQVFLNDETQGHILGDCVALLHDYDVFFVRVDCDLEELERREKERGNRKIGQAKSQLNSVHSHEEYDLAVNTSKEDIDDIVLKIENLVLDKNKSRAFKKLYEKLQSKNSVY